MRKWLNAIVLFVFAVVLVPAARAADAGVCFGCHESMEGPVNVNQEKYSKSVHGSFECTTCHMTLRGEQHQEFSGKADKETQTLASLISSGSKVDSIAQAACAQCHPDIYEAYKASVHGRNIISKKSSDGPVCTSCHGSPHYIQTKDSRESTVNHFNVVQSCGKCHEEKQLSEKYGFSPLVMERYLESFHGRKLKVGHRGAPSCVSCHGSHDVASTEKNPVSPVAGENKKKTCAKCHPGATDKFVAAITHKPLHPVAHYTEIGLIILTISTFMFIISHVLLDIFADVRDRLFGKKGGNHE